MDKLRLRFSKTGRAIYISHLDLMHTLSRSFSRAGYELKYSQGFNPHPQLSVALPMSLGCASVCELLDFTLAMDIQPGELPQRINPVLPEGIAVLDCYVPERKPSELKYLKIAGRLEYDSLPPAEAERGLRDFFGQSELVVLKKTKRGEGETNIKPLIRSIDFQAGERAVSMEAVISAQDPTLNPELLCQALSQKLPELKPDFAAFTRLETYDAGMGIFR